MAFTHTFFRSWSRPGDSIVRPVEVTAGAEINIDEPIAPNSADVLVSFELDVSQCRGLYMVSNRPVVVETNSSSAPSNVFNLAAGVPYLWFQGDAAIRDTAGTPVTTDITALYVTNPHETEPAQLQIRALFDPTV